MLLLQLRLDASDQIGLVVGLDHGGHEGAGDGPLDEAFRKAVVLPVEDFAPRLGLPPVEVVVAVPGIRAVVAEAGPVGVEPGVAVELDPGQWCFLI